MPRARETSMFSGARTFTHAKHKGTLFWTECECGAVCRRAYFPRVLNHCGRQVRFVGRGKDFATAQRQESTEDYRPSDGNKDSRGWDSCR